MKIKTIKQSVLELINLNKSEAEIISQLEAEGKKIGTIKWYYKRLKPQDTSIEPAVNGDTPTTTL